MISNLKKSRWFFYVLLVLLCSFYWCLDSAWSYISYERNINTLLFMVPSSFLDTFLLKVSPYQTASRLGVLLLLLFSGTLLIELSNRKQKIANTLHENEIRYQYLMDHANVGACVLQDLIITIPNFKLLEIFGYSKQKLEKLSFIEIIHPDDRDLVLGWCEMALAGENPVTDTPFQILTKVQKIKWLQLSTTPIVWQGKPAQYSVFQDVTKHKILNRIHQDRVISKNSPVKPLGKYFSTKAIECG